MLLNAVEDLIVSGLSSSCEEIVDQTVEFWNSSFGLEDSLKYPDKMLKCLSTLRNSRRMLLPHFPLDLEDESNVSSQQRQYDTAREEMKTSGEMALSTATLLPQTAQMLSTETKPTINPRSGEESEESNKIKSQTECRKTVSDENEDLLSQQSQLDSQLLAENQSDVCKHAVEQLDPVNASDSPLVAKAFEEPSNYLSEPDLPKDKNDASGYSPRIARGNFFREFNRLNERNNNRISPQSSIGANIATLDEELTETASPADEAETESPVSNTKPQSEHNGLNQVMAPLCGDEVDKTITTSIERENPSEGQFLIERSALLSSTPPSSDIDTVMIADSLLLPSKESHTAVDREKFSTPLESIDDMDSSSAEDASNPWQAYLNSSPPTSVGIDGSRTVISEGADNMHELDPLHKRTLSGQQLSNNSHRMQGSVQKFPVQEVIDIEHQKSEGTTQNEERSTVVTEGSLVNTNISAIKSAAMHERATSTDKLMTGSDKDSDTPTRKRSSGFAEPEETGKRLRQDNLSEMHVGLDTSQLDLASAAPTDVCQEEEDETARAPIEGELPMTITTSMQGKSKDIGLASKELNCNQNSSPMNLNTTNADVPEAKGDESSSEIGSRDMLKRRRSRRFEIDIEHVQLTTPKRRKRSATDGSIEHIRIPSVEQESGSPCSSAAHMQTTNNDKENHDDQNTMVDHCEATVADGRKENIQHVYYRTNETTQEASITKTTATNPSIEPKANSDDHSTPVPLPEVSGPISPSCSLTPSSSQSTPSRVKAKPASILGRLRRVLSDCKQLVLGSQEEREFDDVLFEVRKEVHEAGRRGRDGGGREW